MTIPCGSSTACRFTMTGSATRKPRLAGGDKGRDKQNSSLPGSPAPRAGSFTARQGFDAFVKCPPSRHTGESRYPELSRKTGFRVKHGMTKKGKIDFLRVHQGFAS